MEIFRIDYIIPKNSSSKSDSSEFNTNLDSHSTNDNAENLLTYQNNKEKKEMNHENESKNTINIVHTKRQNSISWSNKEEEILFSMGNKNMKKKWNCIAKLLKNKTPSQCYYHFNSRNPLIKRRNWTNEEDKIITELYKIYGRKWEEIARYLKNRTGKQVRDRFLNKLDTTIHHFKFSDEEDKKIFELYLKFGSSWSKISNTLKTRSSDMIKSRFYSSIKKKYLENPASKKDYQINSQIISDISFNANKYSSNKNNKIFNKIETLFENENPKISNRKIKKENMCLRNVYTINESYNYCNDLLEKPLKKQHNQDSLNSSSCYNIFNQDISYLEFDQNLPKNIGIIESNYQIIDEFEKYFTDKNCLNHEKLDLIEYHKITEKDIEKTVTATDLSDYLS